VTAPFGITLRVEPTDASYRPFAPALCETLMWDQSLVLDFQVKESEILWQMFFGLGNTILRDQVF
jgi:hypothetical protein